MTNPVVDWSPADHPEAIALSEIQWWQRTAELALLRMDDPDDDRISWFSSRQIDARQLVIALRQLLYAVALIDGHLRKLGLDQALRDVTQAQDAFKQALPGLADVRNALVHFDKWALGDGRGPQKRRVDAGAPAREVASEYWGFEYDPGCRHHFSWPPNPLGERRSPSRRATRGSRVSGCPRGRPRECRQTGADVKSALIAGGLSTSDGSSLTRLIVGSDNKLRLSLRADGHAEQRDRGSLANRIVGALRAADIRLLSHETPDELDVVGQLASGRALICEIVPR
ncbi:hypothetical protein SAMN05421812_102439 [Asanoa hainanensis]|uniref:Uncharacterized protein n=1 Tax=Asanoa hainanensis TaxID=560556 RepID=A0A239IKE8_9ACTN|nr:hypothetical protein [Asanoa hainanensis]SNS94011.1 hypothetical protein SAMN05421812_102439 [Asanoa hainanensis]